MYEEITQRYAYNRAISARELFDQVTQPAPDKVIPAVANARGLFGSYQDFFTKSTQQFTVDILEGLYRNTLMFGIIEKLTEDIISDGYTITTGDQKADDFCNQIKKLWTVDHITNSIRDMFTFGTSFDFIQFAKDKKTPLNICELPVRYVTPKYDGDNSLLGYTYVSSEYFYDPTEVVKLCFARPKGEYFGIPLAMPAAAMLELLLQADTDIGILLDRYAIPIIVWLLNSGKVTNKGDKIKTDPAELKQFLMDLKDFKSGEDIALDGLDDFKLVGTDSSIWNFDGSIDFINQQFHATCGVPAMMLGYKGDNNAITTRQMQTYYQKNKSLKASVGGQLIETFYKQCCERQGWFDLDYEATFPKLEIEERSQKIQWVRPMYQDGVITADQYLGEFDMKNMLGDKAGQLMPVKAINNDMINNMTGHPTQQQAMDNPKNVK